MQNGKYEIWYAIPSANVDRANICLERWKEKGYKTCVLIDKGRERPYPALTDLLIESDPYEGYFKSANLLVQSIDRTADVIVTGGDDMFPDPDHDPMKIAEECFMKFPDGLFVMQPIGDMMPGTDKICGSPWFGRGWIDRAYGGKYVFWPGYSAFFGDEELKEVSQKLRVLWQRSDLTQYHDHWSRPGGPKKTEYQVKNDRHWDQDKKTFFARKASRFPQMWPLAPDSPELAAKRRK